MSSSSGQSPANVPRFQRRTSERAFYEGAFKPEGMDYSNLASDADHPAGSSPWATSPQQTKANFGAPTHGDVPPNNLSTSPSPYGGQASQSTDDPAPSFAAPSENGNSTSASYQGNRPPAEDNRRGEQQYQYRQQHHDPQQRPHAGEHSNPRLQHQQAQQAQHQKPAPQYKLVAKITALERTGRKDPILRFDAYVRRSYQLSLNQY